jgi:hypothetical protein
MPAFLHANDIDGRAAMLCAYLRNVIEMKIAPAKTTWIAEITLILSND